MKKTFYLLLFIFSLQSISAQNLTGTWKGEVTQDGKPGTFIYQMELNQTGDRVSGISASQKKEGGPINRFEVGGVWDGNMLSLQEVKQTAPAGGRSCLKFLNLRLLERDGKTWLEGDWKADGCTPGKVAMSNDRLLPMTRSEPPTQNSKLKTQQSVPTGRWTGHLSQSDREYGFYFEMNLAEDGTGTTSILSDGVGGNATHSLAWEVDIKTGELYFIETHILEKSVPDWRWCMKKAQLVFKKEDIRLSLQGNWEGYIEGLTEKTGACAPGKLYLERPLPPSPIVIPASAPGAPVTIQAPDYQPYIEDQGRKVQVERSLEVRNKTVKIRVWDNGTVDGDVLSLFLNGEQLLKNYRVTRARQEIIVQLEKSVNYLILHAVNLGSISPNTVAVSVDDGIQEQTVIVSSNLNESGAVMIKEFTVK